VDIIPNAVVRFNAARYAQTFLMGAPLGGKRYTPRRQADEPSL